MTTVLAIETSCDETAVAVIRENEGNIEQIYFIVIIYTIPDLESSWNVDQDEMVGHNTENHIETPPLDDIKKTKMSFITRLKVCFAKVLKMNFTPLTMFIFQMICQYTRKFTSVCVR